MTQLPPRLDALDVNYRCATNVFITTSLLGETVESHDLCIVNTGLPVGDFNLVFPKDPASVAGPLDRAAAYFGERGLPYRVQVRSDLAEQTRSHVLAAGLVEADPIPGMRLEPLPDAPKEHADLKIRRVADAESLADFQQTAFGGFGLPTEVASLFLSEAFLDLHDSALFVGYADGQPCATGSLIATGDVAGVYWIATLDAFRGRGFGAALTSAALAEGRRRGCRTGSLQASAMGRPVYERMGFACDRTYATFDAPGGSPSAAIG